MTDAPVSDRELAELTRVLIEKHDPREVDRVEFRGAQFDLGLAWVHFPRGKGGLGAQRGQQGVVDAVLHAAGVQHNDLVINPVGIGLAAPVLHAYADDWRQHQHLRPIFTGEELWCQLFSEPTHGSDVAGLRCRAAADGDEWVVTGQKVWTSLAHVADFGLLLARTDPEQPKHRGLSYFILDMSSPGIEIRPLFQLTGEAEFNEVFLDDVRVPGDALLGRRGDGWTVALTTLAHERASLGDNRRRRGGGHIRKLLDVWQRRAPGLPTQEQQVWRDAIAGLWIRAEVVRLTNQRAKVLAASGPPGPSGSITKLMAAELTQHIYEVAVGLSGAEGMLHEPGYPMTRGEQGASGQPVSALFLRSRAATIEGGTSEIVRNIIGERVLGLPAQPAADKDVAWKDVPTSLSP